MKTLKYNQPWTHWVADDFLLPECLAELKSVEHTGSQPLPGRRVDGDRIFIGPEHVEQYPYMSKRFMLERFLGLSEEEINKNERMWREENDKEINVDPEGKDLRSIGISSGDIETDLQTGEEAVDGEDMQMNPEIDAAGQVPQPTEAGVGTPAPAGNGM